MMHLKKVKYTLSIYWHNIFNNSNLKPMIRPFLGKKNHIRHIFLLYVSTKCSFCKQMYISVLFEFRLFFQSNLYLLIYIFLTKCFQGLKMMHVWIFNKLKESKNDVMINWPQQCAFEASLNEKKESKHCTHDLHNICFLFNLSMRCLRFDLLRNFVITCVHFSLFV